ncbi:MAG: hypothetical protein US40_C0004G0028 [Candidatus Roizmanbacteria bacterium GW2011_GWC2_37_13]|uniref:Transglycosylase SLT domain-containing protein n=1 Tax=Candidatus Roizmanbacteria bacterium GW2011_GWC2_37_13 TaxID=1618486 RepID=A0A0G0G4D9_9BACT|nr:MAG: hypothetical protein US38_C0001G0015 [Candidatus Roizmanbacteria bacterium GW2011_GWC1_37_12]KKQ25993.1 MAG: hypothetical protein US40_C0004G0028 [Candidatus Roizmanbacteria bacterium GW2011_GWC2_37_13]
MTPGKMTRILSNLSNLWTGQDLSLQSQLNNGNNSFNLPTGFVRPIDIVTDDFREIPNQIISRFSPTPAVSPPKASATGGVLMKAGPTPTKFIQPTKIPKPTRPPDVFPIDPSLARYGKTTDEVFTYASQKTCVPKEVLRSIAAIESGGFFDVVDPKYFLLYNSENWWNSQFLTEERRACSGYDYDNGSGIIPSDSKYAGHNCHSDGSTGPNSYIWGPMQVTGTEQTKFASQVKSAVGGGSKKIDRRIILDAILIVGFVSKQNVNPTSCTNWTAQQVAKAACGYYGSCGFKDGTYYCNTFCRNYKTYGGKTDCQGAVNQMQDNCWGQ